MTFDYGVVDLFLKCPLILRIFPKFCSGNLEASTKLEWNSCASYVGVIKYNPGTTHVPLLVIYADVLAIKA